MIKGEQMEKINNKVEKDDLIIFNCINTLIISNLNRNIIC